MLFKLLNQYNGKPPRNRDRWTFHFRDLEPVHVSQRRSVRQEHPREREMTDAVAFHIAQDMNVYSAEGLVTLCRNSNRKF